MSCLTLFNESTANFNVNDFKVVKYEYIAEGFEVVNRSDTLLLFKSTPLKEFLTDFAKLRETKGTLPRVRISESVKETKSISKLFQFIYDIYKPSNQTVDSIISDEDL